MSDEQTTQIHSSLLRGIKPEPDLSVSQWAERPTLKKLWIACQLDQGLSELYL